MSKRMGELLRHGEIVGLRHQGKVLHDVKVITFNHGKRKYEGTVELVDMHGVQHTVPLSFEPVDVVDADRRDT